MSKQYDLGGLQYHFSHIASIEDIVEDLQDLFQETSCLALALADEKDYNVDTKLFYNGLWQLRRMIKLLKEVTPLA